MAQAAEMKRWMFILSTEQYDWIKQTATEADVDGVVVMRLLLDKAMADKSGRLQTELMETKLKDELQKINNEIAEREERRQTLSRQLKKEKVLA